MTSFQPDECLKHKSLRVACENQGLANLLAFPEALESQQARREGLHKDPTAVPTLLGLGNPLVTTDKRIADRPTEQNIPDHHPGIIIIQNARPTPTPGRDDILLGRFKSRFEDWHQVRWSNSVVEVSDEWAVVRRIADGRLMEGPCLMCDDERFADSFRALLQKKAQVLAKPNPNLPS